MIDLPILPIAPVLDSPEKIEALMRIFFSECYICGDDDETQLQVVWTDDMRPRALVCPICAEDNL